MSIWLPPLRPQFINTFPEGAIAPHLPLRSQHHRSKRNVRARPYHCIEFENAADPVSMPHSGTPGNDYTADCTFHCHSTLCHCAHNLLHVSSPRARLASCCSTLLSLPWPSTAAPPTAEHSATITRRSILMLSASFTTQMYSPHTRQNPDRTHIRKTLQLLSRLFKTHHSATFPCQTCAKSTELVCRRLPLVCRRLHLRQAR